MTVNFRKEPTMNLDSFEYALNLCSSVDIKVERFTKIDEFMFGIIMKGFAHKIKKPIRFEIGDKTVIDELSFSKTFKQKYKTTFEKNEIRIHLVPHTTPDKMMPLFGVIDLLEIGCHNIEGIPLVKDQVVKTIKTLNIFGGS
jgi:tRNA A37 threonylcarbamoyladenosine dehydratase